MQEFSEAERCREKLMRCQAIFVGSLDEVWSNTQACTGALTDAVELIVIGFGAIAEREFPLDVYRPSKRDGRLIEKQGRIDLLATFRDGSRLAVEIDTKYKSWSAKKLHFAKQSGMIELWIRWDGNRTLMRDIAVMNIDHPQRNWRSTRRRQLLDPDAQPVRLNP